MKTHDIVVVGNGLFGSIATTLARRRGHRVTLISDKQAFAASGASGCVLAPSWLNSLDKGAVDTSMDILGELYTIKPIEFQTNLLKKFTASRVDASEILLEPDVVGRVASLSAKGVVLENGDKHVGKVLLATGVWTPNLAPDMPKMRGLWGCSVMFSGSILDPRIHVYAPYRQAVAFQAAKGKVWMGDGTALIQATWDKEKIDRMVTTVRRGVSLFGLNDKGAKVTCGARPYVEGHKAGYFEQLNKNTWISTGGAKNGTVLAAWQAELFMRSIK